MTEFLFKLPESLLDLAAEVQNSAQQHPAGSPSLCEIPQNDKLAKHSAGKALAKVRQLITRELPDKARQLTDVDLKLLALLFAAFMENNLYPRALSLAQEVEPVGLNCLQVLDRIGYLVAHHFIAAEMEVPPKPGKARAKLSRSALAEAAVQLHPDFLGCLIGECSIQPEREDQKEITSNKHFLRGLFDYSQQLRELKDHPRQKPAFRQDLAPDPAAQLEQEWQALVDSVADSAEAIPFLEIVQRCKLNADERNLLAYLFDEKANGQDCLVDELCSIIARDRLHGLQCKRYFQPEAALVGHGLITIGQSGLGGLLGDQVMLAPTVLNEILGKSGSVLVEPDQADGRLLEQRPVSRGWQELILADGLARQLDTILGRFEKNVPETLKRWGLLRFHSKSDGGADGQASSSGDGASLRLLFSGPSGTGKTLCAEAIAHRLGASLLVTDMSRLLSKWVGESQQNVSAVFEEFEAMAARAKVRPVLLLDECDQFLLKRSGVADSGSDRMHHEMQNLFLDRLERFQGIVVATTNLVEAIDPAFSRRFDYKLVFPEPGEGERERLWRAHLPAGVPLLEEMDFQALAADFAFSGGQIALVMRNAIHEAATRGDGLAMRDLYAAAEVELRGAFLRPNGRPLGFLRSDAA